MVAERGYDPWISGLWAQQTSTVSGSSHHVRDVEEKKTGFKLGEKEVGDYVEKYGLSFWRRRRRMILN